MTTVINYHAYGENGKTIKDGQVSFSSQLPQDEDERVAMFMEAVCMDIGEEVFESEVVGVVA